MLKQRLRNILDWLKNKFHSVLGGIHLPSWRSVLGLFTSWWRLIAVIFGLVVFLYYPFGGWLINNIDTNTSVEIQETNRNQSATAEMMSYLINREVNDKMWTPNLPFIFPSYFLDNMPSFQLGIFSSMASLAKPMASRLEKGIDDQSPRPLWQAAEHLRYPGTIWMFSPQNKLKPVPSATSQYRKARRQLIRYNQALNEGTAVFYRNPYDLAFFLKILSGKMYQASAKIEDQIREESSSWWDRKADNLFYYTQGQVYADFLLLKALAFDYENIIVGNNLYPEWTRLLKTLENASQISPWIVRNGKLSSTTAPNHLSNLGFYTLKAAAQMDGLAHQLENNSSQPRNNNDH